ncbi:hypothetical protein BLOT_002858 [Blomia tropicalis]|nr:hypothetical protein BLOT_002858 [Blomia tropicalis]
MTDKGLNRKTRENTRYKILSLCRTVNEYTFQINLLLWNALKICYISILTERHHLNRVDHKSSQLEHDNENEIE